MGSIEKTHSNSNQFIHQEQCGPKSKWLLIAFSVGGVVGILFISLGGLQVFGAIGDIGFIAALAGGGGLTLLSIGGFLWIVRRGCGKKGSSLSDSSGSLRQLKQREIKSNPSDLQGQFDEAIGKGDLTEAKRFVRLGANINGRDGEDWQPLHRAIYHNQVKTVEYLLQQKGININTRCQNGKTALHLAAEYPSSNPEMIEMLISAGIDVDTRDDLGRTPLHYAASSYNSASIRLLLVNGAEVDAKNKNGRTPLHLAILHASSSPMKGSGSFDEIAEALLNAGANTEEPDKRGKTPSVEYQELCQRNRAYSCSSRIGKRLMEASKRKKEQADRAKLKKNFAEHKTIHRLCKAIESGDLGEVQRLAATGVDLNRRDRTTWTPLFTAVHFNKMEIVEWLITQEGIQIDAKSADGRTALHEAARNSMNPEIVTLLIDAGANIEAIDKDLHHTPLHYAAAAHNINAMKVLIEAGAKINVKNVNDRTPLHIACLNVHLYSKTNEEVVKFLIDHGADKNAKDKEGNTPWDCCKVLPLVED